MLLRIGKHIFCKPVTPPRGGLFTLQACKLVWKLVYINISLLKPISYLPYLVGWKLIWKQVSMETIWKLDFCHV
jgi:hypothetical protein